MQKIGFDTAEIEPFKVWDSLIFQKQCLNLSRPSALGRRAGGARARRGADGTNPRLTRSAGRSGIGERDLRHAGLGRLGRSAESGGGADATDSCVSRGAEGTAHQ